MTIHPFRTALLTAPSLDTRTMKKPKVVLFLPSRVDPAVGDLPSADLLPLEMLHIAPTAERAAGRSCSSMR